MFVVKCDTHDYSNSFYNQIHRFYHNIYNYILMDGNFHAQDFYKRIIQFYLLIELISFCSNWDTIILKFLHGIYHPHGKYHKMQMNFQLHILNQVFKQPSTCSICDK